MQKNTLSFLTLIFLIVSSPVFAQFENEFKNSFKIKPKLDIKADSRGSFIKNFLVVTAGIKVGLNYNNKVKFGLGYNLLFNEVSSSTTLNGVNTPVKFNYRYFSPYIEYVYFDSKRWNFCISSQIGIGEAYYNSIDVGKGSKRVAESMMISYEPAMYIDYKIIKYLGIGTGVGYRVMIYKNSSIDEQMTYPEYILKVKVYFGEIFKTFTGKDIKIVE